MLEFLKRKYSALLEERAGAKTVVDGIVAGPTKEERDLTEDETGAFTEARAAVIELDAAIDEMARRIADLEADEARSAELDEKRGDLADDEKRNESPTRRPGNPDVKEPATYRRGDPKTSFVRDMFVQATNGAGAREAGLRLERNTREVEARALTTTAGGGGEFAPPAWLVDQYVTLARAARPTADLMRHQDLPMGISSVNVPKLLTGTATAQQANQNTAVQNTDATTGSITANIVTIAGQQIISQQLLDQSGVNMDDILLADLVADYNAKLDLFVLNNNATNAKGLLQQAGTTAQTYTSGTPTTALLYANVAAAIAGVQGVRYLPPTAIIMHPRRWAAFIGAADTTGRPIYSPSGGMNNPGTIDRNYDAQGPVGQVAGLPAYTDPQIPTNLGAGTNQDPVIVLRTDDCVLWEGSLKTEAFRETKADQLSILLRVYNYAAFTCNRYAASVAVISGTGLTPPVYGS